MNSNVKELLLDIQTVLLGQYHKRHAKHGRLALTLNNSHYLPEFRRTAVEKVLVEARVRYLKADNLPNRRDIFVMQHMGGTEVWSGRDVRRSIYFVELLRVVVAQYGAQAQKRIRLHPFLNHPFPPSHPIYANQRPIPGLVGSGLEFPLERDVLVDLGPNPQKGLARVIVSEKDCAVRFEAVVSHDPSESPVTVVEPGRYTVYRSLPRVDTEEPHKPATPYATEFEELENETPKIIT
ncbi:hypothetical protein CVT24_013289 [Panaeolus cyanescens]|uniref:Uncharacterized protein n=1 Tax=Panaeolus cyanescens TaxID=181874 RepID=A0A409VW40_9AGAR|nr:hypothetical protein CVT24_013289 [Panaeolus cyanescens]